LDPLPPIYFSPPPPSPQPPYPPPLPKPSPSPPPTPALCLAPPDLISQHLHLWQAKRCDYSKGFRSLLKDVLLSRIGKDIVGGMVKQARAKIEPKEETELLDNESMSLKLNEMQNKLVKQEMQNMLLKQKNELKDQIIEAQKQEIEQLQTANAALVMQDPYTKPAVNLSDFKDDLSEVGTPDLSDWPLSRPPSPTPSMKSQGAKTLAYGI
jgi:Fe-S cluster biosynthesis and repair protein YggX